MTDQINNDEAPSQELFFRISGTGEGHWETERPQPALIQLVQRNIFHGEVLDIGYNAIYIAMQSHDVRLTGIDLVPKAIEVAREKTQKTNVDIRFEVVNMLDDLANTHLLKQHGYDIVLNAAVFHVFSNTDREFYIRNLEYLIKPDGLYIQLCFSEKEKRQGGPRRIRKTDLHNLFSSNKGWTVESIEDSVYESTPAGPVGLNDRAYLSLIRQQKASPIN